MQSSDGHPRGRGGGPEGSDETHGREPDSAAPGEARHAGYSDPWYDALASGWGEVDGTGAPAPAVPPARREQEGTARAAEVYLEVQRSAAFQEVRSRYRRFVIPALAAFLTWYVAYLVTAQTAPGLMARPVAGAVNVAMLAGLGQFLTTFLFTWAYVRHARLRRDRAALDLRWDTEESTRGLGGGER